MQNGAISLLLIEFVVSPDVVLLAVGLAVPDKAGAVLVEEHLALTALETGRVPLQVGCHTEDVLVVDLGVASHTQGELAHSSAAADS